MPVCKAVWRVIRYRKISIMLYLLLPILISTIYIIMTPDPTERYEMAAVDYALDNRDIADPLSAGLAAVLAESNTEHSYPGDEDELRDQLFYRELDYALEIPAGFFAGFRSDVLSGTETSAEAANSLLVRRVSHQTDARQFDLLIERYLRMAALRLVADPGIDGSLLAEELVASLTAHTDVTIIGSETDWSDSQDFYFRFLAYGLLSAVYFIIALALSAFRQRNVLPRELVSPMPYGSLNIRLTGSVLLLCAVVWLIYMLIGGVFFGREMLSVHSAAAMLNAWLMMMVAAGIAFLVMSLVGSSSAVNALGNVLPLAMCFLGGVFVPTEFLGRSVRTVARFTPTYWYTATVGELSEVVDGNVFSAAVVRNELVLLGFSAVLFAIALATNKLRNARSPERLALRGRKI